MQVAVRGAVARTDSGPLATKSTTMSPRDSAKGDPEMRCHAKRDDKPPKVKFRPT